MPAKSLFDDDAVPEVGKMVPIPDEPSWEWLDLHISRVIPDAVQSRDRKTLLKIHEKVQQWLPMVEQALRVTRPQ